MIKRKNEKDITFTSDDLGINRGLIVRVKTTNINKPNVIEINMSCVVIPKETYEMIEYENSIQRIRRIIKKECKDYIKKNPNLNDNKLIFDFNFSSANLRKGYKKAVTISLYVQQKRDLKITRIKNDIKKTIKDLTHNITDTIREENFYCYKSKKKSERKS